MIMWLHNLWSEKLVVTKTACYRSKMFRTFRFYQWWAVIGVNARVNARLFIGDKKNIAVNLFSKLGEKLGELH